MSVHEKDTASSSISSLSKRSRVSQLQMYDVGQSSCGVTLLLPCENKHVSDFSLNLLLSGRDVKCHWISTWKQAVAFGAGWAVLG